MILVDYFNFRTCDVWEAIVTTRRGCKLGTFIQRVLGYKRGSDVIEVEVYL